MFLINLTQTETVADSGEHGNEISVSIKCGDFLTGQGITGSSRALFYGVSCFVDGYCTF